MLITLKNILIMEDEAVEKLIFFEHEISNEEYFKYARHINVMGLINSPHTSMQNFNSEFIDIMGF